VDKNLIHTHISLVELMQVWYGPGDVEVANVLHWRHGTRVPQLFKPIRVFGPLGYREAEILDTREQRHSQLCQLVQAFWRWRG